VPPDQLAEADQSADAVGGDSLSRIWERLSRPFDVADTVEAILGLAPVVVKQYVGTITATSGEALELLNSMPTTIRSLATSMNTVTERCHGEIRGPVLWSETMSARASSNGVEDLFVCKTPYRAYDITENRVLVAALRAIREAAEESTVVSDETYDDQWLRSARRNGDDARRWMNHPSLRAVTVEHPSGRALRRTATGRAAKSYAPAIAVLRRANEPLSADDLRPFCDRRTRAQHGLLMAFVDRLERGGNRVPEFRAEGGALFLGPIQYYHPRTLGNRERLSGIVIGNLLVDVPDRLRETSRSRAEADLRARAGNRRCMVVMNRGDVETAFDLAISLARR
jgi:hypothetical protein